MKEAEPPPEFQRLRESLKNSRDLLHGHARRIVVSRLSVVLAVFVGQGLGAGIRDAFVAGIDLAGKIMRTLRQLKNLLPHAIRKRELKRSGISGRRVLVDLTVGTVGSMPVAAHCNLVVAGIGGRKIQRETDCRRCRLSRAHADTDQQCSKEREDAHAVIMPKHGFAVFDVRRAPAPHNYCYRFKSRTAVLAAW